MSWNRTLGRLEGTHAFPLDDLLQAWVARGFLDQIDIASQERNKVFP
jgi:hypothetical protein